VESNYSNNRPCEKLFEPITFNGMTIKNRIVMTAMHLNYTPTGEVTSQFTDFYRERVAGGAGLIVVGGAPVNVIGGGSLMLGGWDDRFIPGLAEFVEEMKKTDPDVRLGVQLYHAGRYAWSLLTGQQPISSSAVSSRYNKETPRALEIKEMPEVQQDFADSALRFKKAGFDTIEIVGSAGYLINQFLSPAVNKRTDEYGGSFENRARFGIETVQRVRKSVGDDYPIFMRVAGADFVPGGHTNAESAEACALFEKAGVDAFSVTGGWHETRVPQLTMSVPRGAYAYLAQGIRNKVTVPVVACNRINDPQVGERILAEGRADMVGIARGLIADAELPNKAQAGSYRTIRKCIACNQGCFDHVFMGLDVNCLVNFRAGREGFYSTTKKADSPKNVVVIGGGPGGCEAARVAAELGHRVTLFEQQDKLGGGLRLCAAPPGREEFYELINFHAVCLAESNIDVRMSTTATVEAVKELDPDLVVYAGGAEPVLPALMQNTKHPNVHLAKDVLLGNVPCFGDTVIVGGGAVGCETALYLSHNDQMKSDVAAFLIRTGAETAERVTELINEPIRQVHLVEMLPKVGEDIGKTTRWTMMLELRRSGIAIYRETKVLAIKENGVRIQSESGEEGFIECANVVVATGYRPKTGFAESLVAAGLKVQVIGDAASPRMAINAIEEGFKAAWNL
jgi:2,4-dienoyl-CoA reductase-like NADH-dependent reductase (Old Yellow Enzyme family)/thioredoxin reductase